MHEVGLFICLLFFVREVFMELFLLLVCLFVFPLSICLLYSYSDSVSCLLCLMETERTYAYVISTVFHVLRSLAMFLCDV